MCYNKDRRKEDIRCHQTSRPGNLKGIFQSLSGHTGRMRGFTIQTTYSYHPIGIYVILYIKKGAIS